VVSALRFCREMEGAIEDGIEFELRSSSDLRMQSKLIYSLRIVIQTVI
jgi:hypothetical protein